jgi:hypothetical protein
VFLPGLSICPELLSRVESKVSCLIIDHMVRSNAYVFLGVIMSRVQQVAHIYAGSTATSVETASKFLMM